MPDPGVVITDEVNNCNNAKNPNHYRHKNLKSAKNYLDMSWQLLFIFLAKFHIMHLLKFGKTVSADYNVPKPFTHFYDIDYKIRSNVWLNRAFSK